MVVYLIFCKFFYSLRIGFTLKPMHQREQLKNLYHHNL